MHVWWNSQWVQQVANIEVQPAAGCLMRCKPCCVATTLSENDVIGSAKELMQAVMREPMCAALLMAGKVIGRSAAWQGTSSVACTLYQLLCFPWCTLSSD
jgi:hypothetical protein